MVYTDPKSKWNKTIAPFLEKKKKYRLDAWGMALSEEAEAALNPLIEWIDKICPTAKDAYPGPWQTERHVLRAVMQTFLSDQFSDEFAEQFKGMDEKELEECAESFRFSNCIQRDDLNRIMMDHAPK